VDGSGAGLGAGERDAALGAQRSGLESLLGAVVADPLDDGGLHAELDKVEREEPDDIPDPDDTDPATRDGVDLGEAPRAVGGDDGGDELGDAEGADEGGRGTLKEEERVRTGDEDQGLGDDSDLEIDDHVELLVVGVDLGAWGVLEGDVELVLEEIGLEDHDHEGDSGHGEVQSISDGIGEDLGKVPTIRRH